MSIHNPNLARLGRRAVRHDARTLMLGSYTIATFRVPPSVVRSHAVSEWGMMANDKMGDCTAAGWGHLKLLRSTLAENPERMSDEDVIALYIAVTGAEGAAFDPKTGSNDNGCVELDVLNYLRKSQAIGAYMAMRPQNLNHVQYGISAFEGVYMGASLPLAAQEQDVWDLPADQPAVDKFTPGSWGGHCMIAVDYNADGVTFITWGDTKKATWRWWNAYVDEAYAIISPDMFNGAKPAPSGFNLDQLTADLKNLG